MSKTMLRHTVIKKKILTFGEYHMGLTSARTPVHPKMIELVIICKRV